MRTINNQRPKAFIGAAISVGTQLIGGIIGGAKKRKAEKAAQLEQERQAKLQAAQQQAAYMTENAENDANVYKDIRNQLMKNGGNISRKRAAPLIAEGGTAIPIKKDSFLLKGRKHNTGGIVIGKGKNSIEAEGDEVVQITPKQLKVFSAQPILNGNSPAELVQKGVEPSKVFNAQESFKDKNGLNDDGTKKKRMGGKDKLGKRLADSSKSQLLQRIPKENKFYINKGTFGGGKGGGAGTGTKIHPNDDLYTISKTDTLYVPIERNFNEAFSEARKAGVSSFDFQGKKYNTKLGDNPNNYAAGQNRKETIVVPIERNRKLTSRNPNMKMKLGGLSRSKDYGSDKKPYPSVKSKDFAGGGRSYPIPTKADARDALRLAGLHGRSDVRAKVYKKYPELKKSALGSKTRLLKNNYNNFGLEKDYSKSFAPNAITKANMNSVKTNSVVPGKPIGSSSSFSGSSKFSNFMNGAGGEAVSAGIGAAGSLISGLLNKGSIDKVSAPQTPAPQLVAPAKLKTTVNINPQLSDVRESELRQNKLIEGNTASSVASIARQQRVSNNSLSQRSRLRGEKENMETQLQNQDAMNRQQVASANAQQVNEANRFNSISATQTANDKIQASANNRTQMIEGITSGVRDYQLGVDKRRSEENATAAMMSANPEQMELFLKSMNKNKSRLGNIRSTLFKCGGKKKIA